MVEKVISRSRFLRDKTTLVPNPTPEGEESTFSFWERARVRDFKWFRRIKYGNENKTE
jgi:hypothetical protein